MSWENIKLGEVATVTSSKRIFASQYTESGVPFYRQKEIIDKKNKIEISDPLYISYDTYLQIRNRFGVPKKGDLLITAVGATLGIPFVVDDEIFYFKDGNLIWLKNFSENINSRFVYYWITSDIGQKSMWAKTIGSAQPALTIDIIKQIEVPMPPIEIQNSISNVLCSFDILIENNQRQIKLLEEAAQRLYKEWFVDLRFPGYETTPIIDGVPQGWKEGTIQDIVVYHDKKRKPLSGMQRAEMQGKFRYYGAAGVLDYVNNYLFDGTYLLLGEDGTVITEDGYPILQYVTGKFWVNNHAHVLTGNQDYPTEYLYMLFKATKVSDVVTGVAQPKISQARLSNKKTIIPNEEIVYDYCSIVTPMFKQILSLEHQIELSKEARDRLLPKLMSGELEV